MDFVSPILKTIATASQFTGVMVCFVSSLKFYPSRLCLYVRYMYM